MVNQVIKTIENGEEKLNNALENGKVVLLERENGFIVRIDEFDNKEALIKFYVEEQTKNENDFLVYKTAKEAYVLNCNVNFSEYLQDFMNDYWEEGESLEENERISNKCRNMLSYDEVNKSDLESDYVDGFYEFFDLLVPFNNEENLKFDYISHQFNDFDEVIGKHNSSFEILFKK